MADDNYYSPLIGGVYLFNLLLGTGVLTMPAVFQNAGYVYGTICIALLCLISYIQATFIVESMANANFIKTTSDNTDETSALLGSSDGFLNEDDNDNDDHHGKKDNDATDVNDKIDNDVNKDNDNLFSVNLDCKSTSTTSTSLQQINEGFQSEENEIKFRMSNINNMKVKKYDNDNYGQWNDVFKNKNEKQLIIQKIVACFKNDLVDKKFQIIKKFELGNMTEIFLNKYLSNIFFISIIAYLFGDLLIYNSMMSKSLRDISCTSKIYCNSTNKTHYPANLDSLCWDSFKITRRDAYRIFLIGFIAILGPLTYAKIQKTKNIQIMTIILRWAAFSSMLGITLKMLFSHENQGDPIATNIKNVPKLFGICVYSFMCHHSIPSMLTPIRNKSKIFLVISIDYLLVLGCYFFIALTAIGAFSNIEQVYTLNFQIDKCKINGTNPASLPFFDIFLPTFPIFTLFSSYTILALTLINNMKVLIKYNDDMNNGRIIQYVMPLIAIIPPFIISIFTEDVSSIVQYVGSYSGTLIQYVFPSLIVYYSRKQIHLNLSEYVMRRTNFTVQDDHIRNLDIKNIYQKINPFKSFFQNNLWLYMTAIWWIICLCLVTFDHLRDKFNLY